MQIITLITSHYEPTQHTKVWRSPHWPVIKLPQVTTLLTFQSLFLYLSLSLSFAGVLSLSIIHSLLLSSTLSLYASLSQTRTFLHHVSLTHSLCDVHLQAPRARAAALCAHVWPIFFWRSFESIYVIYILATSLLQKNGTHADTKVLLEIPTYLFCLFYICSLSFTLSF